MSNCLFPPLLRGCPPQPAQELLGFIKFVQWFASIFAFATCDGFKDKTKIQVSCSYNVGNNKTITTIFGYLFMLNQASSNLPSHVSVCYVKWEKHVLIGDDSPPAQFYATFAVCVFLSCIVALVLYVG